MRKASPRVEKTSPTKMRVALGWASRNPRPWARRKSQRQKTGRHLMRALTHDGLDEGSQSTKYTQVALKKGTSLGPSLFTWRIQDKGSTQSLGVQRTIGELRASTFSPDIRPRDRPTSQLRRTDTRTDTQKSVWPAPTSQQM